ncbi:MAG: cache domain-containing protein, partial [Candidatus Colwellbacteria bacterium]|nr:cache domain-containing protein [Candidatus Colwellbacteria bacterium]
MRDILHMYNIRTTLPRQGIFFALTILGLIALNVIWIIPTLRSTRGSASVFALTVAERVQSEINGSLGNALNEIKGVAGEAADEPERINSTFRYLLLRNPTFTSIALVDRNARELVRLDSSGLLSSEKFIDQSRNTSFYLGLQNRTAFTQPVVLPNGEVHVTLIVPVPTKVEFIERVIIAELNIQHLLSIIRSPKIGEGHVYVLDRDGVEILNPNPAKILRRDNFSTRAIVKKVFLDGTTADGLASEDRYVNENGVDTFTVGM